MDTRGPAVNTNWRAYPSLNDIRSLTFARDGSLWAGTSRGVMRWDLASDTHTRYGTSDGLVSEDVTKWSDTCIGNPTQVSDVF